METESAILSDALAEKVKEAAGASAHPVFSLSCERHSHRRSEVPYSLVAALDRDWPADAIYLNEWAAKDLGAKGGDPVTLEYYYWEPSGSLVTRTATFRLAGILRLTATPPIATSIAI